MNLLRRLRGVASTALLWAATWGLVGAAAYAVMGIPGALAEGRPLSVGALVPSVLIGALFLSVYGLLSGAAFAGVLMLAERGRGIQDLSIRRVATWGAVGGIGILSLNAALIYLQGGGIPNDMMPVLAIMGLLGAGCAAGSLALARRAPRPETREESSRGVLSGEQPLLNRHSRESEHGSGSPARAPAEQLRP